MTRYKWEGIGPDGRTTTGVLAGESPEAIRQLLRRRRIRVLEVEPEVVSGGFRLFRKAASDHELAVFTRQLAVMVDAGLPLVEALEELVNETENKRFAQVIYEVLRQVEAGSSLARSLRQHPFVFGELYCSMVEAGEASGGLDLVLNRLSDYIERIVKLKSAVRSASVYPAIVMTVAALVVMVMLWRVIPVFAGLFSGLGAQLPLPTRITIEASNFVGAFFPWIIAGSIPMVMAVRQYYRTDIGQKRIDTALLKIPIIGPLLWKIAVSRFCRTLATLTNSGVAILEGLEITSRTSGNRVIGDAALAIRDSVEAGRPISATMRETKAFPGIVSRMIAVGERTGQLEAMLNKVADFYEAEVDVATKNLTSLIEPLLIVFLGVVIGFIVISMYLPMFDLINKI